MGWKDWFKTTGTIKEEARQQGLNEAISAFEDKNNQTLKSIQATRGEGWDEFDMVSGYGNIGISSFQGFYKRYLNKGFINELQRINEYRSMAETTEVADIIEDATNESVEPDNDGKVIHIDVVDKRLSGNENILKNISKEFYELFYERIDIEKVLWDMFRSYLIDGKVYYERIIDKRHPKKGVINIKKLPCETMDFDVDPMTGKIQYYYQYLSANPKKPSSREEAEKRDDIIVFNKEQIGYIDYGVYGRDRTQVLGYLEKVRIPFNQLKLLETSVIIYRIVRAPQRLVFRIDTGNMPKDKAHKYVEKVKQKMTKKQTYDPESGTLSNEPNVMSILENYYMAQSADGRGSNVDSIGGDAKGFTELDDIYYFARKMYRALKYPSSRVTAGEENRSADIVFGQGGTGEISRDEIKWAKFLERQQNRFCKEFVDLFLLNMDFKGMKEQYGLNKKSIRIRLNSPSKYREQQVQNFLESRFNNYTLLADREEFSKYYLLKKFLKWSDEEITENVEGIKKDKELGLAAAEGEGGSW